MKCSLDVSNFLEEISNLSHSVVFLYFFAWFIEEDLISPCYSLERCIQLGIFFSFLPCLSFLSFLQLFIKPPQITTLPLAFLFIWNGFCHCFLYSVQTSIHSSSGILSTRYNPLNLLIPPLYHT